MKYFLIVLILACALVHSEAQEASQKIGHADWEFIFSQLPEYKAIESELKAFEVQLQNQLKIKAQEFELKYKAFRQLPIETPEAIKRDKASELNYLKENMESFQQDAEASMQKKQNDLISPLLQKVGKAIETVAREDGYAYIVNPRQNNGSEFILFADDKFDISAMVLRKLGVDVSKQIVKPTK